VGPNGRGKSTLLRFLAARKLPVPPKVDVLLVEQEVAAEEGSVVEQVPLEPTILFWWRALGGHRLLLSFFLRLVASLPISF
jgi:ABC-type nitrate/sulfonate/bicarbonate transport system ATPase subunit